MAKFCQVTEKGPMVGNKVSHSNIKTRKRVLPNLSYQRFWVPSKGKWVRIRVSAKGKKIIAKRGVEAVFAEMGLV